jgi:hypothetical protein
MQRQLAAFVEQPCKATFLAARDAVLDRSPQSLSGAQMAELDRLLEAEEYEQLLDCLDSLPPSKVLSPRIHFLAAEAADSLGHWEDIELERCLFVITLRGLLTTGDGTQANPYIVCHNSDEQDILETLGHQASRQSLVENGGHLCDVVLCTDGREMWFDVTQVLGTTAVRARKQRISRRHLRPSRVGH